MTTHVTSNWILPLTAGAAPLELVGGKGASLAELTAAGFSVPPGFTLTTEAYRRFVAENDLQGAINSNVRDVAGDDPAALARAAADIHTLFNRAVMPPELAAAIREAYAALGVPETAVAVRSSATAEDLPGLSFAGQQETFLDVRGEAALLEAVVRAWASLWTARAIGYRQRMGVGHERVAMAVIVQIMVAAEVAGVLFTAHPTTGDRDALVINAASGLGETVVAGTVTPDTYVVDRARLETTSFTPGGEVTPGVAAASGQLPTLTATQVRQLAALGWRVEEHFDGEPQDIEWAFAAGRLWLLQARPITGLPPAPPRDVRWESPIPGSTWIRRQVVEHMPQPLSPLFEELYLNQGLERSVNAAVRAMGQSELFAEYYPRPYFTTVNGYAYMRANLTLTWRTGLLLLRAMVTGPLWLFRHGTDYWRNEGLPHYLATIARWQAINPTTATDEELLRGVRELAWADAIYWFAAAITIGTAKVSDWVLDSLLTFAAPGQNLHSGHFLRGFPSRTLEAEAELDAIAARARASAPLRELIAATPAASLPQSLPDSPAGRALRDDLERYFARYGHQIYNLDFVEPTLGDAPLPVLLGLKALVQGTGQGALARQERVTRERERLTEETAQSFDPVRRFLFRRIARWAQMYTPFREEALFFVGAGWPTLRRLARELGERLAAAGVLTAADDVYFLTSEEIASARSGRNDLGELARERRALREARERLHPPAAVPPEARFQLGSIDLSERETQRRNPLDATVLAGFPVSPGRVTAPASVIRSPDEFARMEPGTILVCPTTTPAWTPLFVQARGLVTDIGGILAHGSIVAREYGIPAVMGTGNGTRRISSGQEITVDGSAGTVTLGEERHPRLDAATT